MKKLLRRFTKDTSGNFAVILGVALTPIAFTVGVAVDYTRITQINSRLQEAVDTAALAAAKLRPDKATYKPSDEEIAPDWVKQSKEMFYANLSENVTSGLVGKFPPDISVGEDGIVTASATVNIDMTFGSLVRDILPSTVTAKAMRWGQFSKVCLLALNPTASSALAVSGTADITAVGCSAYANSNHSTAITQIGVSTITAERICTQGGFSGSNFTPEPETGCGVFKDPLASGFATGLAVTDTTSCNRANATRGYVPPDGRGVNNLSPGVYCAGTGFFIKNGYEAVLTNGVYVFSGPGPLSVSAQGILTATNATIILTNGAYLDVHAGGTVNMTASKTGAFAGIAIAQDPAGAKAGENIVIGGGQIEIEGLLYFPSESLTITGAGDISMNSDAFAIIADTISVEGNGQLNIGTGAEFETVGLPGLPGFEGGREVRLVE